MKVYYRYFKNPVTLTEYINSVGIDPTAILYIGNAWHNTSQCWVLIFQFDLGGGDETEKLGDANVCH